MRVSDYGLDFSGYFYTSTNTNTENVSYISNLEMNGFFNQTLHSDDKYIINVKLHGMHLAHMSGIGRSINLKIYKCDNAYDSYVQYALTATVDISPHKLTKRRSILTSALRAADDYETTIGIESSMFVKHLHSSSEWSKI